MVSQFKNDPVFDQTYHTDEEAVSFPSHSKSVCTSNSPSAAATALLSGQSVAIAEAPVVDHDQLSNPPDLSECTPAATVNEVDSKHSAPELVAVDRLHRLHAHASSVNKKSGEKLNPIDRTGEDDDPINPGPDESPRRWSELNLRVEQLVTRGGQTYAWKLGKGAWVSQDRALNPIDTVIGVRNPFDFVVGFTARPACGYPTNFTLQRETRCFEGPYAEKMRLFVLDGAVEVMLGKPDDSLVGYVDETVTDE
ncbi:hypothetical protein GE09DRAFT_1257096 [Coniochaeta sp. 2T2.1]|nr:hypothetical protein GE09DRAFT_472592 [Coniochaeta sp. 2T2.1]KAB5526470.1 hypothetical protein GE09DRAFT_1257096 [Coniochaeta sp. 2T2.1]